MTVEQLTVATGDGSVPALLSRAAAPVAMFVLAHGAGAGYEHPFMVALAAELAGAGVSSFRFQFPYMARGSRRPDHERTLCDTVVAAVTAARAHAPDVPMLAGGKSMGGRMAAYAAAEGRLPSVRGLAFFGFPLHPAGRPGTARAARLDRVRCPMLFIQGSRDRLAAASLIRPVCADLGARLHVVEGADHGFAMLRSTGRTQADALTEGVAVLRAWLDEAVLT